MATKSNKPAEWLREGQACHRLGVSPDLLARIVAEGRITTLTLPVANRGTRYSAADVDSIVEAGTRKATRPVRETATL